MKQNDPIPILPVILSYGRPDRLYTYKTLRRFGWTGPIRILCSDDDPRLEEYRNQYPNEVLVFSKNEYRSKVDEGQNYTAAQGAPLYARRAIHDLITPGMADVVWELDDDYFHIGTPSNSDGIVYMTFHHKPRFSLDHVLSSIVVFLKHTPAVRTLAFAQSGDFYSSTLTKNRYFSCGVMHFQNRKVMNSFFYRTSDPPLPFAGTLNDDVNMYLDLGLRHPMPVFTYPLFVIYQGETQQNHGGMTDIYRRDGTYIKSMHTVIRYPSAVKVKSLKSTRWHHTINWNKIQMKIISEKFKKNSHAKHS